MGNTNKSNKKAMAYEVVQMDNDKLKLIEGRYALSKKELDRIDNMVMTVNGKYKIEKDPKTGKIVRIADGKNIGEINENRIKRKIEAYLKENESERGE